MKISLDFITNSSSCSFICDICGKSSSGLDIGLSDAGMIECMNGHIICEGEINMHDSIERLVELNGEEKTLKILNKLLGENYEIVTSINDDELCSNLQEFIAEDEYDMSEKLCPLCLGIYINDSIKIDFLLKKYNENIDKIAEDIRMIGDLNTIKKFLKE